MNDSQILRTALWEWFNEKPISVNWIEVNKRSRNLDRLMKCLEFLVFNSNKQSLIDDYKDELEQTGFMRDEFLSSNYSDFYVMVDAALMKHLPVNDYLYELVTRRLDIYLSLLSLFETPKGPIPIGGRFVLRPPTNSQKGHLSYLGGSYNEDVRNNIGRWLNVEKVNPGQHIDKYGMFMLRQLRMVNKLPKFHILNPIPNVLPAEMVYWKWKNGSFMAYFPDGLKGIVSPQWKQNPVLSVSYNVVTGDIDYYAPGQVYDSFDHKWDKHFIAKDKDVLTGKATQTPHNLMGATKTVIGAIDTSNKPIPTPEEHDKNYDGRDIEHILTLVEKNNMKLSNVERLLLKLTNKYL